MMTSHAARWLLMGGLLHVVMATSPPPLTSAILAPSQNSSRTRNASSLSYHMMEEKGLTWHCPEGSVLHPQTCECRPLLCSQGRQLEDNRCRKRKTSPVLHLRGFSLCVNLAAHFHTGSLGPASGSPPSHNASARLDRVHGYLSRLVDVVKATFHTEAQGMRVQRAAFWAVSLDCNASSVILRHIASVSLLYQGLHDVSSVEESLLASSSADGEMDGFHMETSLLSADRCQRDIFNVKEKLSKAQCAETSIKPSVFEEYNLSSSNQDFRPFDALSICAQVQLQAHEFLLSRDQDVLYLKATGARVTSPFFEVESDVARVCVTQYLVGVSNMSLACTTQLSDVITIRFPTVDVKARPGLADVLSVVCTCVSVTSLLLTLVTFCAVRRLRTVVGSCHVAFVVSLALAQAFSQLSSWMSYAAGSSAENKACVVLGLCMHFLWLTAALWLHVCTALSFYAMVNPLSAAGNLVSSSALLLSSSAYCLVLPSALLLVTVGASYSLYGEIGYGGSSCFIRYAVCRRFFFALPLGFIVVVNIALYVCTAAKVRRMCSASRNDVDTTNVGTCARLSAVMGAAWLLNYAHQATGQWEVALVSVLLFGMLGPLALWGMRGPDCLPRRRGLCQTCTPDPRGTPAALPQGESFESVSLETNT